MAFDRPTLTQLIARCRADLEGRVTGLSAAVRRSFETALVRALAGMSHGLHGHLEWVARQVLPTAESDLSSIKRWGGIWGVTQRSASAAAGPITITGTSGTSVPQGTQFQSADGLVYATTGTVSVATTGEVQANVLCTTTGAATNQEGSAVLTIVTPITGVTASATVTAAGLVGGADDETRESLYDRVVDVVGRAGSGGGPGDYVAWALTQSGVTRAWEFPHWNGLGNVGVAWVYDDAPSLVPTSTQVAAMQAYLDTVAPVNAVPVAIALAAVAVNFTMRLSPNTSEVRSQVQSSIEDLFARVAEPGDPSDSSKGKILLSQINEAISLAPGEVDHTLTLPAADVQAVSGTILVPGTFTFSS